MSGITILSIDDWMVALDFLKDQGELPPIRKPVYVKNIPSKVRLLLRKHLPHLRNVPVILEKRRIVPLDIFDRETVKTILQFLGLKCCDHYKEARKAGCRKCLPSANDRAVGIKTRWIPCPNCDGE